MRALVQRVTSASVTVADEVVATIGPGLLVLVGVTHTDTEATAAQVARKVAGLRILRGERSVSDGVPDSAARTADGSHDDATNPDADHGAEQDGAEQDGAEQGGAEQGGAEQGGAADPPAVLAVSQFTLYGDTRKGRRPTWAAAAPGPVAEPIFRAFVDSLRDTGIPVQTGVFGADMRVGLVNDGPITVMIEI